MWAISRYDDVVTVLKNPQLFSSEGFRRVMEQPWLEHNPSLREMSHYFREVLEARRQHPTDDMVGDLLRARVDGESLTQEELMGFLYLLLMAGLETTAHLLGHMSMVLADQPEVWNRLRADVSLVPRFVEEVLRYEPPVHTMMRLTTDDVTLGGVHLPRNSPVLLLLGSANHDEQHFPGADRFDLDRPGPQNLPFGHGIHFCLGSPLARLEARVALEVLLARCGRLTRGSQPVSLTPALSVRGPVSLPLELHPG